MHHTPPPRWRESRLLGLVPGHLPEIEALLAEANPGTDARPFEHPGQHWVGVRDASGRLVACGVRELGVAGHPILSGITVDPAHRGQGLGLAVTAYLTRRRCGSTGCARSGCTRTTPWRGGSTPGWATATCTSGRAGGSCADARPPRPVAAGTCRGAW